MKTKILILMLLVTTLGTGMLFAQGKVIVDVEVDITINDDESDDSSDDESTDKRKRDQEQREERVERIGDFHGAGGGGSFYGWAFPYFDEDGVLLSNLPDNQAFGVVGGYGYGVDSDGTKIGGFGLAYRKEPFYTGNDQYDEEVYGGAGGLITGFYERLGPVTLSINGLFGFGSIKSFWSDNSWDVHFLWQGDIEIGIPIVDWFQVSFYGGYQGIVGLTNFSSEEKRNAYFYPVAGIRLTWGSF